VPAPLGLTTLMDDAVTVPTQPQAIVAPAPPTAEPAPPDTEPNPPTATPEEPPSTLAAPEQTSPPDTAPAERPPIPEGCREPEFRRGEWRCDDD
jgi:hypothetical protein